MSRSDIVDLVLILHVETELAWWVSEDGDPGKAVQILKSQAEIGECRGRLSVWKLHDFQLPEWLAIEKGLV